ncbi:MAG TPA: flagellar basal body-associated FliL family protein [Acidobacteriota bacterium]|nr:flagellar basal body-associated FliL family protein [Acidobacteriota bacterium]
MAEQLQANEAGQEAQAVKKRSKLWIILPVGFLFAIISAGLGAYLGGIFSSADSQVEASAPPEIVNETFPLDPIVIQLADDTRKQRFVRLSVTLGLYRPEDGESRGLSDEVTFQPRVQDRLIFAIGSKTSDELNAPGGRQQLKDELLTQIGSVFPENCGKLKEVYITELLIQ